MEKPLGQYFQVQSPYYHISEDNGEEIMIARLDRILAEDETLENYARLEAFETFERPGNMKIRDYLNQFWNWSIKQYPVEQYCQVIY